MERVQIASVFFCSYQKISIFALKNCTSSVIFLGGSHSVGRAIPFLYNLF